MNNSSKPTDRKTKRQLSQLLVTFFENHPDKEFSLIDLAHNFSLRTHPAKLLCADILDDMVADDYLTVTRDRHYRLNSRNQVMVGVFQRKRNGHNAFLPDGEDKTILVSERNSLHAMDGDRVKATLVARRRNHTREAQIVEVLKRSDKAFVGRIKVNKNYAFLISTDRTLPADLFIPKNALNKAVDGDKVLVRIVDWPEDMKNPIGKVVDVLGQSGDNTVEMHAILAEFGLPYQYPQAVVQAAEKLSGEITAADFAEREDMRGVTTFTIDPADAKDFDDALSIRTMDNGLLEIGVHIADVTHFVKEGDIIDREARKRATSIYLVDRTIPMLPERLCNDLCSLRPHEDRLTYSAVFLMTEKGEIKNWRCKRMVINSDRRFTYEEVQNIIEQNGEASPADLEQPGEHPAVVRKNEKDAPVGEYAQELLTLNRLAKIFRAQRMKGGSIEFDRPEVRFLIDEEGHPTGTYIKVAKDANKLVEEFMLLANRYVAQKIGLQPKGTPTKAFVYRIHDVPDSEKLERLQAFVSKFGYKLRTEGSKEEVNKSFNQLLNAVRSNKEREVVEDIALRTMKKACYSTTNIGHYGLMFRHYTHFTSPIRRYPDDLVHRLLDRYDHGGRTVNKDKLEELCLHCSEQEVVAEHAERASIKYKQVEFLNDHLGEVFEGKISGVNEFGIYVMLDDNSCEGRVAIHDLPGDYYEFDEDNYCLRGRRYHRTFSLGDRLTIRVARANFETRQLDFVLEEEQ